MASIAPQESVTRSRGKSWAYAGAIVGGAVSVAANVAHSFRPPKDSPAGWHPQLGAVMLAAFWPLALLLAVEVMVRVDWPRARRWTAVRFGGVTPVAIVAAIVSYRHLSGLLDWYGEDGVTVALGPLAVDGLMVVSTGALLALASRIGSGAAVPVKPMQAMEPVQVMRSIGSHRMHRSHRLHRMRGRASARTRSGRSRSGRTIGSNRRGVSRSNRATHRGRRWCRSNRTDTTARPVDRASG
jgi:hypothetical protein